MSETPVSIAARTKPTSKLRTEEQVLAFFEGRVEDMKRKIKERYTKAKNAFYDEQGDLPSLRIRVWEELNEEEREAWRFKVGIN